MECHDHRNSMDSQIIKHSILHAKPPPWFDLRVFYVRVSSFKVDESTPEHLTLNHIPLEPNTILEVNGGRSHSYSELVSTHLRRDRVDKESNEAIFVNTDSMRISRSLMFEVFDSDVLLLSGVLELCNVNGHTEKAQGCGKRWTMKCELHSLIASTRGLMKGKQCDSLDMPLPTVEVYVAGCFSAAPIILSKTLHPGYALKNQRKLMLHSIPEYDSSGTDLSNDAIETIRDGDSRSEDNKNVDDNVFYSRRDYIEDEDGELSWFNAGVRVGVGIGLGICIGVGLGVGLLVHSYHSASRNFKRRIL